MLMSAKTQAVALLSVLAALFSSGCQNHPSLPKGGPKSGSNQGISQGQGVVAEEPKLEIFFYINGDNDLINVRDDGSVVHQAEALFDDLQRVSQELSDKVALHAYFDPNSDLQAARYGETQLLTQNTLSRQGETDSTDPLWLEQLLSRGISQNPDTVRILVFWGHGNGWRDVPSYDYSHPEQRFNYLDTAPVLKKHAVDLVLFDACAMGYLEVMSALSDSVKYLVASPRDLPVQGVSYRSLAASLNQAAESLSEEASIDRATVLRSVYERLRQDTAQVHQQVGLSAPINFYDLTQWAALRDVFNDTLDAWMAYIDTLPEAARAAEWNAITRRSRPKNDRTAIDLKAFIDNLRVHAPEFDISHARSEALMSIYESFATAAPGTRGGTAQFFLPKDFRRISDSVLKGEISSQIRRPGLSDLENWRWASEWTNPAQEP